MTLTVLPPSPPTLPPVLAGLPREEAIAWLSRLYDAAEAGHQSWSDAEILDRWLAQCSRTGSAETRSAYAREIRHLAAWIDRHHPGTPLRGFDPVMAEAFVADLREQVAAGTMAPRSFNRRVAAVSSLFRWASEPNRSAVSGVIRNPMPRRCLLAVERTERAVSEPDLGRILTEVEVAARTGSRIAARDAVLIRMAYLLGCRVSELARLQWRDVEALDDGGQVHLLGKGSKPRTVRISADTLALIESLPGGRGEPDAWLFPSNRRPGQHLTRQAIGQRFARWGRAASLRFFPHAARHSHASHALRKGCDLHLISTTLGHRSLNTTQGYLASNPGDSSSLRLG
jgi:integrase